eukprot:jgi/Picre1/30828/NNA_006188.t1
MADVSMKSANEAEFERFSSPKTCPSCGQKSFRHSVFRKHIHRCCPDLLMVSKHTHSADGIAHFESERDVEEWLRAARAKELELHKKALDIAFRQRDEDDNPIRQGPEEIAQAIGAIDVSRAQKLLKSAMKAIPLAEITILLMLYMTMSILLASINPLLSSLLPSTDTLEEAWSTEL